MKPVKLFVLIIFTCLLGSTRVWAQKPQNWTEKQLMEPSELAGLIQSGRDVPVVISVGPGASIPGSVAVGMTRDSSSLVQLKKELTGLPKNKQLVIYCGCCPFDHCPNVRPAIDLLRSMKFSNYRLLNLPHNLKADWIEKGYPVN